MTMTMSKPRATGQVAPAVWAVTKAEKALAKAKGPTAILYAQIKLAQAEEALQAVLQTVSV